MKEKTKLYLLRLGSYLDVNNLTPYAICSESKRFPPGIAAAHSTVKKAVRCEKITLRTATRITQALSQALDVKISIGELWRPGDAVITAIQDEVKLHEEKWKKRYGLISEIKVKKKMRLIHQWRSTLDNEQVILDTEFSECLFSSFPMSQKNTYGNYGIGRATLKENKDFIDDLMEDIHIKTRKDAYNNSPLRRNHQYQI